MLEAELRDVLFVRAFEEADAGGELVGLREREIASREVRGELAVGGRTPSPEEFLARRAERLASRLLRAHPAAERVYELSARRGLPGWTAFTGALVLGAVVDHLGAEQSIDLLDFPILGLLAYNLVVYLALFLSDLTSAGKRRLSEGRASRAAASGLVARLLLWLGSPERWWARRSKDDGRVAVAAQRFVRDWYRVAAPLHLARGAKYMHLGAAGLMSGAVLGMYLRGLVLHYDASWESTFLSAGAVHRLLETVFAPVSWILGRPVPDAAAIEAMRAPEGAGDAALWIHLYALTGLLWVVLPRLGLAFFAGRSARALERDLPLRHEEDGYFLRLVATERGAGREVAVESYSYRPAPRAADGLKTLLLDVFGGRVRVVQLDPRAYGDDPATPPADAGVLHCRVEVFSLAQSPEHEVHGALVRELARELGDAPGRRALLVVVDRGPYRERLGSASEAVERLEERERTWRRVLREAGVTPLVCDLEGPADADVLEAARDALWPAPLGGEGGA
ncbi:MAG: DUF2868 domain-containing protein [Planctomycetes bacterium]|nr:DUF2868 domain-containing protein [Planctomycetota bacterium]